MLDDLINSNKELKKKLKNDLKFIKEMIDPPKKST